MTEPRQEWIMDLWDANAAQFGIEARFPFWDTTLAEFMLTLPDAVAASFGEARGVHKAALRAVLPTDVLGRPWGAAFNWAQIRNIEPLLPAIRGVFRDGPWASAGYVDRAAACRLLDGLGAPKADAWRDWALVRDLATLEIWMRAM
jgi:hypothetical protein